VLEVVVPSGAVFFREIALFESLIMLEARQVIVGQWVGVGESLVKCLNIEVLLALIVASLILKPATLHVRNLTPGFV